MVIAKLQISNYNKSTEQFMINTCLKISYLWTKYQL